ncbi:hypothetical protein CRYUN_Cryun38cG0011300 [Craigia yunnanensis]
MDLSAISGVVQTIGGLLTKEVTSLLGVEEQVESLQNELIWMQSFLKVADATKAENEVVLTSVAEIRELAYDAEDVIETFALKVASKRKGGISNFIKRSSCIPKEGWLLFHSRSDIEKITIRIRKLTRQLQTYNANKLGGGEGSSYSNVKQELNRSYSHIIEDYIVGLDDEIKKLISVVIDENRDCRVVSLCGMGGLGKTTLAKKLYHHNQIEEVTCMNCSAGKMKKAGSCFKRLHFLTDSPEGIVSSKQEEGNGGEILEDVAECYLNQLVERSKLPSSLGNLRCLQTLNLRVESRFSSVHVPNVIWKLEQLRHLYLPMECSRKTKLKLGTLRNLQTLVNFNTKNCYLEDLLSMIKLRAMMIRGPFHIENFEEDLRQNQPIIASKCLHSLAIVSSNIDPRHLALLLSGCVNNI